MLMWLIPLLPISHNTRPSNYQWRFQTRLEVVTHFTVNQRFYFFFLAMFIWYQGSEVFNPTSPGELLQFSTGFCWRRNISYYAAINSSSCTIISWFTDLISLRLKFHSMLNTLFISIRPERSWDWPSGMMRPVTHDFTSFVIPTIF